MNTVSRRGFLKAAAGVASAGLMLPKRAIAADSSDLIEFNAYKGHATFDATILNSEGEKSGHTMAALGWATYTKGGKTVETLCVYDGWNEIQHINYADTYYVNAAGTLFTYSL